MTAANPAIVVIGATGYTGRLIAARLARGDQPFVLAGRDAARVDALVAEIGANATGRTVDVTDPASLRQLLGPGQAVINCAGPFAELGEPVVRACIDAGAHYLDTAGEQSFIRAVHTRYNEDALEAGVSVTPAMAFEYALGDCAAALGATGLISPLRGVDVIYGWQQAASSRGTRRTAVRMMGRRGQILVDGRLRSRAQGSDRRTVRMASGHPLPAVLFTSGEIITVPRHLRVETMRGWMVVGSAAARVAPLFAPLLPLGVSLLRPVLEAAATRRPDPDHAERLASRFTIRVELRGREGTRRAVEVRGRDPYAVTAEVAIAGARRALEADAPRGVLAPSQLIDPRTLLAGLAGRGVRLVENA